MKGEELKKDLKRGLEEELKRTLIKRGAQKIQDSSTKITKGQASTIITKDPDLQ